MYLRYNEKRSETAAPTAMPMAYSLANHQQREVNTLNIKNNKNKNKQNTKNNIEQQQGQKQRKKNKDKKEELS